MGYESFFIETHCENSLAAVKFDAIHDLMNVWYDINQVNENGRWNLHGYIQDIDQSDIEEIETLPYDAWKQSL